MDNTTTSTGTGTSTGTASYTYTINPPRQYGWICPLCGKANAPWLNQCPCEQINERTTFTPKVVYTKTYTTVTND